jgi:hypothetical protein
MSLAHDALLSRLTDTEGNVTYKNNTPDLYIKYSTSLTSFNEIVLGPNESFHIPFTPPHKHKCVCECGFDLRTPECL